MMAHHVPATSSTNATVGPGAGVAAGDSIRGGGGGGGGGAALSSMDALAQNAEREAQEAAAGHKRKFVSAASAVRSGPPSKMMKDADEIDI